MLKGHLTKSQPSKLHAIFSIYGYIVLLGLILKDTHVLNKVLSKHLCLSLFYLGGKFFYATNHRKCRAKGTPCSTTRDAPFVAHALCTAHTQQSHSPL